jgi:hypothetical protein
VANPVGRSHSAQDRACAPPGLSAAYKPNAGPGASAGGDLCSTGSALRRYPPWPPVPTGGLSRSRVGQKEGRRQLASQVGDLEHGALGGLDRIPDDVGQSSERGNCPLGSLAKLLFEEAVP